MGAQKVFAEQKEMCVFGRGKAQDFRLPRTQESLRPVVLQPGRSSAGWAACGLRLPRRASWNRPQGFRPARVGAGRPRSRRLQSPQEPGGQHLPACDFLLFIFKRENNLSQWVSAGWARCPSPGARVLGLSLRPGPQPGCSVSLPSGLSRFCRPFPPGFGFGVSGM